MNIVNATDLENFAHSLGIFVTVNHVMTGGWELAFNPADVIRVKTMMRATAVLRDRAAKAPRCISITVINCEGAPTTTQLMQGDGQAAIDCIREYVRRGSDKTQTWYKPVIAAYAFDTRLSQLRTFSVNRGIVTEL